jgi:hypothetical protein
MAEFGPAIQVFSCFLLPDGSRVRLLHFFTTDEHRCTGTECNHRSHSLGVGFPETVYENALAHEMRKQGLHAVQQRGIVVRYDNTIVREIQPTFWPQIVC